MRPSSVAFSPTGKLLAVANHASNTISMFEVHDSGALTRVPGSPFATGKKPSSIAFSQNGALLADANTGAQTASVYSVSDSGALAPVRGSPFPTASDPSALAFDPSGPLLAVTNLSANSVSVFSVPPSGRAWPVESSPFSVNPASGPVAASFTPNGRLLATADRTTDGVSVFSRTVVLGYEVATSEGGVRAFGEMAWHGSDAGKLPRGVTVVGSAFDRMTGGYWLLKSNGGVNGFDAPFDGSLRGKLGHTRPVAIGASGTGYLILTADGAVHHFGGATWYGSDKGKLRSAVRAVGLAVFQRTGGYWILRSDGGVDAFEAKPYGSLKGKLGALRPVAIAPGVDGGYLILTSNGAVHTYGRAVFHGSDKGRLGGGVGVVGMAVDPATNGYWLLRSNGAVDGFAAPTAGSLRGHLHAGNRAVAIASGPPYQPPTPPVAP
jgi:hypothetical protein